VDRAEERILKLVESHGTLTLSEIVDETGYSRSWAWKTVRRLEKKGIIRVEKVRGVLRVSLEKLDPDRLGILRIGILRAAEYPYILRLRHILREKWPRSEIIVYDDPYKLQTLLARGSVHLAMLPAVTALLAYRTTGGAVRIIAGGSGGGAAIVSSKQGAEAHVTTMASSMELCAIKNGLPGRRIYASSGHEIVELVKSGRARYGVVWYPYAAIARRAGLKVEPCELESCCVLAANKWLEPHYSYIARAMADSISWTRRRLDNPGISGALAKLIGMPRELIQESLDKYIFYEEPPIHVFEKSLDEIRATILPASTVKQAVYW